MAQGDRWKATQICCSCCSLTPPSGGSGETPGLWHVKPSGRRRLSGPWSNSRKSVQLMFSYKLHMIPSRRGLWLELVLQIFSEMVGCFLRIGPMKKDHVTLPGLERTVFPATWTSSSNARQLKIHANPSPLRFVVQQF